MARRKQAEVEKKEDLVVEVDLEDHDRFDDDGGDQESAPIVFDERVPETTNQYDVQEVAAWNQAARAAGDPEKMIEAPPDEVPEPPKTWEITYVETDAFLDGVGEDTVAAKQSNVDRVIDGEIVRADREQE